jgi:predicted ATPase/Flp pilus assembly protein TadD
MVSGSRGRLSRFVSELRRRNVHRVVISYSVAAWLLIQVANDTFPYLGIADGWVTLVILLVAVGFPVTVVLSWFYDLTPLGLVRDASDVEAETLRRLEALEGRSVGVVERESDPPRSATRLPIPSSPLIGRVRERETVCSLLRSGERIVTITGPGGMGKTRLALACAAEMQEDFPDGVFFVSAVQTASREALITLIAEALGLTIPEGAHPERVLLQFLQNKRLLVVLDNFEELISHAAEIPGILSQVPGVALLATSRERLDLGSECVVPLEGLPRPVPGEKSPESFEAVQLFLRAARRAHPGFEDTPEEIESIVEICALLDGLPLGVELAAAWVNVLSCQGILARIQHDLDFLLSSRPDVPARHWSLRAAFESSWTLLPEVERTALRRLSVFRRGFGIEAAEAVAGATVPAIGGLMARSLVRRSAGDRYEILHVLRQFAEEKLDADPAEAAGTLGRHRDHFATLVEREGRGLRGPDQREALTRLAREAENIRLAWLTAVRGEAWGDVGRMVHGMYLFFQMRGGSVEGADLLGQACAAVEREMPRSDDRDALLTALRLRRAMSWMSQGRTDEARSEVELAMPAVRVGGDPSELVFALTALGQIALRQGEAEAAKERFEEALEVAREADLPDRGRVAVHLGNVAMKMGDRAGAERLWTESLALFRREGDAGGMAAPLCNLGIAASERGDPAGAIRFMSESLVISRQMGDERGEASYLLNLGVAYGRAGDGATAEEHLRSAARVAERMGLRLLQGRALQELADTLAERGNHAEADVTCRDALRLGVACGDVDLVLGSMAGAARGIASRPMGREQAAELLGTVLAFPGTPDWIRERVEGEVAKLGSPSAAIEPESPPVTVADVFAAARVVLAGTASSRGVGAPPAAVGSSPSSHAAGSEPAPAVIASPAAPSR